MTQVRVLLGEGRLNWPRYERVSDRYGSVLLDDANGATVDFSGAPIGMKGRLIASVIETAESDHIGDLFHGFAPETPEVGEEMVLGSGTLFVDVDRTEDDLTTVGVSPDQRDRTFRGEPLESNEFWLDPEKLYRCHWQVVALFFEPDGV